MKTKNPTNKTQPSRASANHPRKPAPQPKRGRPDAGAQPAAAKKKPPVKSPAPEPAGAGERIQKVLARGGIGSRREIEHWIEEGRLTLNGQPVKLGDRLHPGDQLYVNGRAVTWENFAVQPTRVLLYHKPVGEVVTRRDPEGRPVVFDNLPKLETSRWVSVGRLDINTSGLLLLTNNGELANRLMHPSTEVEREYAVRILGEVSEATLERLKQGVELEDGKAKFDQIHFYGGDGANKWYHVIVSEGRNRLVRRLWESQEVVVSRLMRVRYGPVVLPDGLRLKGIYELTQEELDLLFEFAGLERSEPALIPEAEGRKSRRSRT